MDYSTVVIYVSVLLLMLYRLFFDKRTRSKPFFKIIVFCGISLMIWGIFIEIKQGL